MCVCVVGGVVVWCYAYGIIHVIWPYGKISWLDFRDCLLLAYTAEDSSHFCYIVVIHYVPIRKLSFVSIAINIKENIW